MRIEGVFLGAGLALLLLGSFSMLLPPSVMMSMSYLYYGSSVGPTTDFSIDLPLRILPSQFVEVAVSYEDNVSAGSPEVWAYVNYQYPTKFVSENVYRAINQSQTWFTLGWVNASLSPFAIIGFGVRVFYSGTETVSATLLVHWFGNFTYFAGLGLVVVAAIPFWGFALASWRRRRLASKGYEEDSEFAERWSGNA